MIKYNLKDINDWNFDNSNVIKVYRNGAVVYYKVSGESPTPEYQVCFAVVDNITQYSEREFEDVYDKATEKWYKLNNLGQYEEYGVYASGRTSCEGSRLPHGYTEVEYVENTTAIPNTSSTSRLAVTFADSIPSSISGYTFKLTFEVTDSSNQYNKLFGNGYLIMQYVASSHNFMTTIYSNRHADSPTNSVLKDIKYEGKLYLNEGDTYPKFDITNVSQGTTVTTNLTTSVSTQINGVKLGLFNGYNNGDSGARTAKAKIYEVIVTDGEGNELCHSVPCTRDSDGKVGFYNLVRNEFDYDASGQLTLIAGAPISPTDCVTTYKGKLTIDEGYEYEWDDSSWINLGEVSGDSRLPHGYTEVEYVQNTASGSNTSSTSRLAVAFEDSITNSESAYTYEVVGELTGIDNINAYFDFWGNGYVRLHRLDRGYRYVFEPSAFGKYKNEASTPTSGIKYRMKIYQGVSDTYPQFEITDITAGTTSTYSLTSNGSSSNNSTKLGLFHWYNVSDGGAKMTPAKIYEVIVTDGEGNELCHSVPCTRDSDGKVGFYNLARDEFDYDASGQLTLIAGPNSRVEEYPKYYEEKDEPLNNLTFNTLEEAQTYARNNCVYDGLKATINGNRYYFDSSDENGWVEGGSRLPQGYTEVEYIENTSSAYINTEVLLYDSTTNSYEIETKMSSTWGGREFEYLLATEGTSSPYNGLVLRWNYNYQSGRELQCENVPKNATYSNIDNGDGTSGITVSCSSTTATNGNNPLTLFCGLWSSGPWRNGKGKIYDLKITKNNTLIRDLVPCTRDNDEMVGMYDIVNDVFYYPPNYQSYQLIAGPIV